MSDVDLALTKICEFQSIEPDRTSEIISRFLNIYSDISEDIVFDSKSQYVEFMNNEVFKNEDIQQLLDTINIIHIEIIKSTKHMTVFEFDTESHKTYWVRIDNDKASGPLWKGVRKSEQPEYIISVPGEPEVRAQKPSEISRPNIKINIFQTEDDSLWFGEPIQKYKRQLSEQMSSLFFSFDFQGDALDKVENKSYLLRSPIWVFHEDILSNEDQFERISQVLLHMPVPESFSIIVAVGDTENKDEIVKKVSSFPIKTKVAESQDEFLFILRDCLAQFNPKEEKGAKDTIYNWERSVETILRHY